MTTDTVRPQDIPARPWLTADAERWAAARRPVWAGAIWPALAMVAAVGTALGLAPDGTCTADAPCEPEWGTAVVAFLFFCHLFWLWLVPELVLLSAPLLLVYMTDRSLWAGGTGEKAADTAVVVAACWCWASAALRLLARRRQRRFVLDAAGGLLFAAPGPDRRPRRGRVLMATGLALLAAPAAVGVLTVHDYRSDVARASAASRVEAVVVGSVPDEALFVRFTAGRPAGRHRIQASYPDQYPVGTSVPVLLDGDWMRLAAEPYRDIPDAMLGAVIAGGLGSALLASGLLAAARSRTLARTPVPALRVLTRRRGDRTQIYAADDTAGLRPFVSYEPHGDSSGPGLREAILYGAPRRGSEHVLLSTGKSGAPVLQTSCSAARQEGPEHQRVEATTREARRRAVARRRRGEATREAEIARAIATLKPATGPVRWQSGPSGRLIGGFALCLGVATLTAALLGLRRNSVPHTLIWLAGGAMMVWEACLLIIWRITADASGLRIHRLGSRTRHLRWEDVTRAEYTREGHLVLRARKGVEGIRLDSVGVPGAERLLRLRNPAARAASEITAMVREPGLRPPG